MDKFYFSNGESAGSLEEFLEILKSISEDDFFHHVNEERNDFVGWIENCVKDKSLARKIEKLKDKDKIILVIEKKINSPAKIKKGIIYQIKEAILNG
jgi:hypothetical protein